MEFEVWVQGPRSELSYGLKAWSRGSKGPKRRVGLGFRVWPKRKVGLWRFQVGVQSLLLVEGVEGLGIQVQSLGLRV